MIIDPIYSPSNSVLLSSANVRFVEDQWTLTYTQIMMTIIEKFKMLKEIHFDLTTESGKFFTSYIALEVQRSRELPDLDIRINEFYQKLQGKIDQTFPPEYLAELKGKFEDEEMVQEIIIAYSYQPILNFAKILDRQDTSIIDNINRLNKSDKISARL